jgi:hypothetical protein
VRVVYTSLGARDVGCCAAEAAAARRDGRDDDDHDDESYNDYDDEQVKIRGDNVSLNLDLQDVAKLIRRLWAVSAWRACGRGEWTS